MKLFHQIITSIVLMLFIISFAVMLTLHFRPLYYFDINYLDLSSRSGMSAGEIKENYDVLIDYNSITGPETLNFPTLSMSKSGRIHFKEVKDIFLIFEYMMIITAVLAVAFIIISAKKIHSIFYLKLTIIFTIAIPAVLAFCIGINWETTFLTFHQIFFNNDYWIFNSKTDPIIRILPDTFFLHCAIMILGLIVLEIVICYLIYRKVKYKRQNNL